MKFNKLRKEKKIIIIIEVAFVGEENRETIGGMNWPAGGRGIEIICVDVKSSGLFW